jgi:hypothetical protein
MKLRRIAPTEKVPPGLVLTRDAGKLPKGRRLTEADAQQLSGGLDLIELEPDDVHEDEAGRRLAKAAAGEGVEAAPPAGGSFPLTARFRGLVEVDPERVAQVNLIEDLALEAHPPCYVAQQGDIVARAKVVPFVTTEERVRKAEAAVRGAIRVRPFLPLRCALVVQEDLGQAALDRARASLQAKLDFFGASLEVAPTIPDGAQLVIVAGSRSMDPLDPVLGSLKSMGATLVRHGVPLFPGTLLWLAYRGDVPIVGAPSCGIFGRATSLDVLLPRLMTGERLGAEELARMSLGGLIAPEVSFRLAPYKPGVPRGQLE